MSPINRSTSIREVIAARGPRKPLVMNASTSPNEAVRRAGQQRDVHTIAFTDDGGKLVGILSADRLIDDVFADLFPEGYLSDVVDLDALMSTGPLFTLHRACREIMAPAASVTLDDSAEDAFLRMHSSKVRGLPVVNAGNKVIDYVGLLDLLLLWMEEESGGGVGTS